MITVHRAGFGLALPMMFVASMALAQNGAVRAEVDARRVGVDDSLTLSISLEGEAAGLDAVLPTLKNLRVLGGPSTSTQISFINGSMSRQKVLSFVLKAEKSGAAEVGAVTVEGYPPTAPITLDVVPGSVRPAPPTDPFGRDPFGGRDPFEEIFGRSQRRRPETQGKIFVEASLSRPRAHVGEPILVVYFVYTQVSLSGVEFADAPKYPGFWAEEVDRSKGDSSGENVVIQGEPFLKYPVLERLLFPTRAGTLEIPEARLRLIPAGGVFGVAASLERSTKALKVGAEPLPPGAPQNGAVGSFKASSTVDRTSIPLGEAFTFRFTVSGKGNLKWIDAPPQLEIDAARLFPPRVVSDLRTTRQGIEGSKTWEFVVVPEREAVYQIPSVSFPYYDPEAKTIRTEQTTPISVSVSKDASADSKEPIHSARAGVSLRADLDRPAGDLTPAVGLVAAASIAAHVFFGRRRPLASENPRARRHAIESALRELKDEGLLSKGKERMAARIAEAIETVFGPRSEWLSDDFGDRLRGLADDLEFLRFAPQLGSYDTKMKEVRDRAISMLETFR